MKEEKDKKTVNSVSLYGLAGQTFDMKFEKFWKRYRLDMETRLREHTMRTKKYIVELKILPYFGNKRMNDITEIQIKMFDNRIVVESPGKFPGLVRTDNIRHTHFSRNPKIAEFLKAYNYVKEYGEGVDRMCRELESIGLRAPEYRCNAFILQTIIYNSAAENGVEKLVSSFAEIASEVGKSAIGIRKPSIEVLKSAIQGEKLAIEVLKSAINTHRYKEPTQKNIICVYEEIDANQIFGTNEIVQILNCSSSTAREIMVKLREMNVVREVKGMGKGKYRFVNEQEISK